MNQAPIITLFGEVPTARRVPSAFAISFVIHCAFFSMTFYVFHNAPRVIESAAFEQNPSRIVTLNSPTIPRQVLAMFGKPAIRAQKTASHSAPSGGQKAATALAQVEDRKLKSPQTLVNPNEPPRILLKQKTPLPLVVLWSPEPAPVKNIVPAPPHESSSANVTPTLNAPNHEPDLADVQISSAPGTTQKLTLAPSSTSPLRIIRPKHDQQVPESVSLPDAQPTPAAVLSISDLKLFQGKAVLPPANQTAASSESNSLHPGHAVNGSSDDNADPADKENGSGSGKNLGDHGKANGKVDARQPADPAESADSGAGGHIPHGSQLPVAGANGSSSAGMEAENSRLGTHITLPADGRYGAVVVGSSLVDAFPETEGIMAGRLTYTVYMKVGLPRSWILQYALPASADRGINTIRPDAPYPYDIFRPNIDPAQVDSDSVLIHGLINAAGHFERLEVVYPTNFALTRQVIASLDKWQFRPAMQKGLATSVEILLIIPFS